MPASFVENPAQGIERVHQLTSELKLYGHQLRESVTAVGSDEALPFLRKVATEGRRWKGLGDVWTDAVAARGDGQGILHLENPTRPVRLADPIEFISPHCDPTVNPYVRIFPT